MKTLRPLIFSLSLFGFLFMGINGQETKKVHLKVIKGGETTVDTVFYASELEDEDLHKKISKLAGVDFKMMHGENMSMHASHKKGHNFTYVTVDDCEESGGKVKKKIIIKKGGEGEEGFEKVIIIKDGKEVHGKGEHYLVEELEKGHKEHEGHEKAVKEKKGEGDSEEITVKIITDNELHMSHRGKDGVHIIICDDKDGTEIVYKNVKVLKSIEEDGELIEITVEIKKAEKIEIEVKKEKSEKTKQKKDKDRTKK